MKPAHFEYYDPTNLTEALSLLAKLSEAARPLAGGQSLVPMMNFRLARPANLIDLNQVSELSYVKLQGSELRIGAMSRQRELERSRDVADDWPLLQEATRYIGHVQIRNRGTVGGSLAHAYPAAELPVAMAALEALFVIRSQSQERVVAAEDFFLGPMTTIVAQDELLVEVRVPKQPPGTGWAFNELSRRYGDFALAGVAGLIALDQRGAIQHARVALSGPKPVRARDAEEFLLGEMPGEALFTEAGTRAIKNLDQDADIHASAEYRREIAGVLVRRALHLATERATRSGDL